MGFFNSSKDTIGIDPGSQQLRIIKEGALVFNEPAQIQVEAKGKTVIVQPIDYAVADFQAFTILLKTAMKKGSVSKSYIMYCALPGGMTPVQKIAYRDAAEYTGASKFYIVDQCYCAAISLNLLSEQKHFILVDFGSSKVEITVFANSIPISIGTVRMGTEEVYKVLQNTFARDYHLTLSKADINTLLADLSKFEEIKVQQTTVRVNEIYNAIQHFFSMVKNELMTTVEMVSTNGDIDKVMRNGIYFTGGGSTINYLKDQISLDSRIRCAVSQNALLDNINGLKSIIADPNVYKEYIVS